MMQKKNQTSDSINQILEMFKAYNNDSTTNTKNKDMEKSQNQHHQSSDFLQVTNPFSFSLEELRVGKLGLHSSLEKIQKSKNRQPLTSARQGMSSCFNDSYNKSIFDRLYEENKNVKQKRQRLIEQGRRSLEVKEAKQCTFSPNINLKLKTQRSCNVDDIEAFYQKNMNWQSKRQEQIKRKQCQKNNEDKTQLTFVPKIVKNRLTQNSNFKKDKQNKQNHKKVQQSYLTIYQRHSQKQHEQNTKKNAYKSIWNNKKGYFSYAR